MYRKLIKVVSHLRVWEVGDRGKWWVAVGFLTVYPKYFYTQTWHM